MKEVPVRNSMGEFRRSSELAKSETSDCVVVAFAAACEVPYEKAHQFVATQFNREKGKGTFGLVPKFPKRALGKEFTYVGSKDAYNRPLNEDYRPLFQTRYAVPRPHTVGSFLEKFNEGTYILQVRGHALAIKDGVLLDHSIKLRRVIKAAFKVS